VNLDNAFASMDPEHRLFAGVAIVLVACAAFPSEARPAVSPVLRTQLQERNAIDDGKTRDAPTAPADATNRAGPAQTAPQSPRASNWCYTPAINCLLSDYSRTGSSCWCPTPFGPSYGRIR
jgi:hypothetical protein